MTNFEETLSALLDAHLTPLRGELARVQSALEDLTRRVPPQLLTVPEAAAALNVSTSTIRRRIRDGSLPVRRVGCRGESVRRIHIERTGVPNGI